MSANGIQASNSPTFRHECCVRHNSCLCLVGPQRRGPTEGRGMMNDKLSILVRVDLDGGQARIAAQGHVTAQSIQALYVVAKRANDLMKDLALEIDVTRAMVEPDALEQLRACSQSHHLPAKIDPFQADCRLSILAPRDAFTTREMVGVAA